MERYEVVVTIMLDAESPEDAASIAEGLIVIDPSLDDNDVDFVVSGALEI